MKKPLTGVRGNQASWLLPLIFQTDSGGIGTFPPGRDRPLAERLAPEEGGCRASSGRLPPPLLIRAREYSVVGGNVASACECVNNGVAVGGHPRLLQSPDGSIRSLSSRGRHPPRPGRAAGDPPRRCRARAALRARAPTGLGLRRYPLHAARAARARRRGPTRQPTARMSTLTRLIGLATGQVEPQTRRPGRSGANGR